MGSLYLPPSKELLRTVVQFAGFFFSVDSEGMVCVHASPLLSLRLTP